MDQGSEDSSYSRSLRSSDDTCARHRVRWEASIHGKVTTEPDAGSLPINKVQISWELLDNDNATSVIASGQTTTGKAGIFDIVFNSRTIDST